MKRLLYALLLILWSPGAIAQLMTVQQLKELLAQGLDGELAATSYVQGVVDGMLAMDSLYQKEKKLPREFCKVFESYEQDKPVRHPAYRTKEFVAAWEKQRQPMDALAVDMVLAFMTAQYGCKR